MALLKLIQQLQVNTMKRLFRKYAIALVPFALLAQGCDRDGLEAVASLEPTVAQITQKGAEVTKDISDACIRGTEFSFSTRPLALNERSDEFVPILIADRCTDSQSQANSIAQLNNTFALYVHSLVKLASNQTVTFDESLGALGTSIGTVAGSLNIGIADSTIEESAGLANSLLNLWSANFRRDELSGVLICTDDSMQQFTQLLSQAVQDTYVNGSLADEQRAIAENVRTRYRQAYNSLNTGEIEVDAFIQFNSDLENEYDRLMQEISERENTVMEYRQILVKTMETHQSLATLFRGEMTSAEVDSLCSAYNTVEASNRSEERQALLPEVTPSKLLKGKEILAQHAQEVKEIAAIK